MRIQDLFIDHGIMLREDTAPFSFLNEVGGVGRVVKGVNTTPDVQPGEVPRQAKKFLNRTDIDGRPPIARTDGKYPKLGSR
jgi:hypothetical protein